MIMQLNRSNSQTCPCAKSWNKQYMQINQLLKSIIIIMGVNVPIHVVTTIRHGLTTTETVGQTGMCTSDSNCVNKTLIPINSAWQPCPHTNLLWDPEVLV